MLKKLFNAKQDRGSDKDRNDQNDHKKASDKTSGNDKGPGQQAAGDAGQGKRKRNRKRGGGAAKPAWSLDQFKVPEQEGKTRFHDLDLHISIMQGVAEAGFEYASPIQAAVLPHTLSGHDAIGKAQTGTGKTAAFLLTIMNDLLNNPIEGERYMGEPRALIIAPTRELVAQIAEDAKQLGKHTGLHVVSLIGGADYQKQLNQVNRKLVDIVVATPGRLLDFENRRDMFLDQVEILVLDEADRMLDMGFIPQVKRIVRSTPRNTNRQTLLFSATFTQDIINLSERWTHEPVRVEIEPESVATDTVEQRIYMAATEEKFQLLANIIDSEDVQSLIVFANRRDQTRKLFERLQRRGVSCGLLSGEVDQNKRTRTLERFKTGDIKVLVATDVAGRGIHVDGISHVVNYTLPEDPDDYVHRIGRTGRAGSSGVSISFACEDDAFLLEDIEALLGKKLPCELPPAELLK